MTLRYVTCMRRPSFHECARSNGCRPDNSHEILPSFRTLCGQRESSQSRLSTVAMQELDGVQLPFSETLLLCLEAVLITIEVRNEELMTAIRNRAADLGLINGAIVSLIGAVDSFAVSTMPADDANKDIITTYDLPAEMNGTGEIVDGNPHLHVNMAVEGDRAVSGHLHHAQVGTWFARVYVMTT